MVLEMHFTMVEDGGKARRNTHRDAIGVLLTDPLSLRLSLGELMLVLELGSHIGGLLVVM